MTDEEFRALQERYRRADDAWQAAEASADRAKANALRLLKEVNDVGRELVQAYKDRGIDIPQQ